MTATRNISDWALQLSAINRAVDERERVLLADLDASRNQCEQLQAQLTLLEHVDAREQVLLADLDASRNQCEQLQAQLALLERTASESNVAAAQAQQTLTDRLAAATTDLLDCRAALEQYRERLGRLEERCETLNESLQRELAGARDLGQLHAAREGHLLEQMESARLASSAREASATDRALSISESAMRELAALSKEHASSLQSLSDQQRDREAMLLRAASALETQLRADIASQRSEADRLGAETAALRAELRRVQGSFWGRLTRRSRSSSDLSAFNRGHLSAVPPPAAPPPEAALGAFLPTQTTMNSTRQITESVQSAQQLLSLQDESFVRAAYLSILRRPADPGGFEHYVAQVREGAAKEMIIAGLARSPEGKSRPRELPGLKELLRRTSTSKYLLQRFLRRIGLSHGQSIAAQLRQLDNSLYRMTQASAVRFDRLEADAAMIKHLLQGHVSSKPNGAAQTNTATDHRPSIVASRIVLHDESPEGVISELSRKIADSAEASLLSR